MNRILLIAFCLFVSVHPLQGMNAHRTSAEFFDLDDSESNPMDPHDYFEDVLLPAYEKAQRNAARNQATIYDVSHDAPYYLPALDISALIKEAMLLALATAKQCNQEAEAKIRNRKSSSPSPLQTLDYWLLNVIIHRNGPDINAPFGPDNDTLLIAAAQHGADAQTLDSMIAAGAQVTAKNKHKKTAADYATNNTAKTFLQWKLAHTTDDYRKMREMKRNGALSMIPPHLQPKPKISGLERLALRRS